MTDTRLFGSSIALVSGVYSVSSALGGDSAAMPMSASVMLVIGAVAIAHGVALLTPLAERMGSVSGPLMVLWAVVMLANLLLAGMMGRDGGGMMALAVLMLISGLIMSLRSAGS